MSILTKEDLGKEWVLSNIAPTDFFTNLAKKEDYKKFRMEFNFRNLNASQKVGQMMRIAKNFLKSGFEKTFEGFVKYYFEEWSSVKFVEVVKEAFEFAKSWFKALNYTTFFVLYNTFQGLKTEIIAFENLQEKFPKYKVEFSTDFQDRHYGLDIIFKNTSNKIVGGVQVKPTSYFLGKSRDLLRDRKNNQEKYKKFVKDFPQAAVNYYNFDKVLKNKGVLNSQNFFRAIEE